MKKLPSKILQLGSKVQIIRPRPDKNQNLPITIHCKNAKKAKMLALSLAGVTKGKKDSRLVKYKKLKTHPWYGEVILNELNESDRSFIILFITKNSSISEEKFKLKVHRLFLDDPAKPENHCIIQEVLSCL